MADEERRSGEAADGEGPEGRRPETGFGVEEGRLTLRERKKLRTRQRISGEATLLFIRRGFDHVTVAEVARAAEVSTMTVFNYFPRKEDLFLDRIPEARELIVRAVRERGADESPLAALRRLVLGLLAERHPLAGVGEGFEHFWRTVLDSPALRARGREAVEEMEGTLAALLAEAAGGDADRPGHEARLGAGLIVAAIRVAYLEAVARQLGGDPVDEVAVEQPEVLRRTFEALERALPGFA
ncbi:TetR/AcrR family transcriptional regulator [Streptomyces sp. Je 1-4]|uniref:TetR/AcrR family transcriptional regulator n=1 Tax=Streptomyces TaxID=1883 RepID=UPI00140EC1AC|nr:MULTISPECIES: TetR/AcrR family transcriptional regulator [unclassified Streptomyces]QIK09342.1 TetR/AcrR family transcriptional regulator [Streptomyces sp. ID38640]UYB43043.1 TetR/AcrR family transcriptional regulator [Streptomyces sp. Je 1-4]UZQ39394.1 TetR/AcrR family transcriptional regulator [Streptomyces sp. Je 1-4] [Streptomyces sp. Je 1-4 4N24]UZQ46811.1 TetR/AcrR family transcriptional regulator [Streptomyces sp. Je 1-4] [Streptomyces sp. Je 1-4 4N24_ara]